MTEASPIPYFTDFLCLFSACYSLITSKWLSDVFFWPFCLRHAASDIQQMPSSFWLLLKSALVTYCVLQNCSTRQFSHTCHTASGSYGDIYYDQKLSDKIIMRLKPPSLPLFTNQNISGLRGQIQIELTLSTCTQSNSLSI